MATANFNVKNSGPGGAWFAVTSAGVDFIAIRSNSNNHPFFVTTGSSTPNASVIGYKVTDADEFWVDVPVTENYYVRVPGNVPPETRIDVFYVLTSP